MHSLPHHPFVDYPTYYVHPTYTNDKHITKQFFNCIDEQEKLLNERKRETQKLKELKPEQRYPKIRVSHQVFKELKAIQEEKGYKSFGEVVKKLLNRYGEDIRISTPSSLPSCN
ncbi:hypothetical protein CL6EHI_125290 [Entamoeba histolytica]|uniref:Uncharacterized protein n=3 Tax=Entamoeba histolytica TaxID=5759 RepID=C4M5P3_ENTH1|nr:hypothetical protein EHI_040640 [Entamoeba histolytica HM-1:IMSS]XP_651465.1 hypothetical protein EHI_125290 [Entamoeba histolytica HM-1:IMSS]EMD47613.1 Hypothetical protein EHI5A_172120 [Entamoeba histolytica KU27]GAT96752.1 hypothetical protein CL6EHI_040640 [Entamoeba histolytica]EAL46067.1 hypothetical protein EHI_040640 [Entamoeba histolytica HM-1:IMSS]EAL46079.1 hypothetical protein EHI_125290 [Entamoeba histolytica HM-1:IMSS]GAT96901.1 hypothetical protein CL6EHI_125290 [Entamoeba h|eukprot:XP_651453.1 hypothetical protein EHI_040640 [Entamoeba histolytica HM-1:IMSS]